MGRRNASVNGKPTMRLEKITPSKAREWLKVNKQNRPYSEWFADHLASAIADKVFVLNGDAIRFDVNGQVIDGQHRLWAIVKSGVAIESYVIRGLPPESFDTIDRGHVRTNAHVLARHGEKHYAMLAAVCQLAYRCDSRGVILPHSSCSKMRPDEIQRVLSVYGTWFRPACAYASHTKTKLIPSSEVAFFVATGSRLHGDEITLRFWNRVLKAEELKSGTPEHTLFKRLSENMASPAKLPKQHRLAYIVKAVNANACGKPMKALRFSESEDMPAIINWED